MSAGNGPAPMGQPTAGEATRNLQQQYPYSNNTLLLPPEVIFLAFIIDGWYSVSTQEVPISVAGHSSS